MSESLKSGLIVVGVMLVLIGGTVGYLFSAKFAAQRMDNAIVAQDESMQNTFAMNGNMLKMSGITVSNYAKHDIEKIKLAISRYSDKPNMMMMWVKEQGNTMSPELHKKLLSTIEKVAARKEKSQLSKISVVQSYRNFLDASFKGSVAKMMGTFPSAKAQIIMDRIITNKATKQTWVTGNDEVDENFLGGN